MEFALGLAMLLMALNTTVSVAVEVAPPAAALHSNPDPALPYFADELLSRNVELARHTAPDPQPRMVAMAAVKQSLLEPPVPTVKPAKSLNIQLAMQAPASDMYIVDLPPKVIQEAEQLAALPMKPEGAKLVVTPRAIQWELKVEDGRLDKAIRRWAKEAGYTFRWDADRYVLIAAGTTFSGTFEYAVEQVLETPGIKNSEYPLEACVYNNEPPLLRITRLGDQKEECR
ncbi:TcpQ domain-containing protein [Limnobacter sp.]|uniref:TcpQ domain-containing protein n=1 Tax=Limnobacter sp. TaxID=2003368 RepID=UPI002FE043B5